MIITCPCGIKKYNLNVTLIPSEGRLLQCGSCDRKWYYTLPSQNDVRKNEPLSSSTKVSLNNDEEINKLSTNEVTKTKINIDDKIKKKKSNISLLSVLSLIIISFLALIILLDTFKFQITKFIPNFSSYLFNLYVTINDIYLFFIDLIR